MKKWTRPDCYMGEEWLEWYVAYGQHRDSDMLTQSNFAVFLRELGGESETVRVIREGHWAVGWVEWIGIHESDSAAVAKGHELEAKIEDYPALDEDDWSNREWEYAVDVWNNCYSLKERVELCQEHNISVFAARHPYLPNEDNGSLFQHLVTP